MQSWIPIAYAGWRMAAFLLGGLQLAIFPVWLAGGGESVPFAHIPVLGPVWVLALLVIGIAGGMAVAWPGSRAGLFILLGLVLVGTLFNGAVLVAWLLSSSVPHWFWGGLLAFWCLATLGISWWLDLEFGLPR